MMSRASAEAYGKRIGCRYYVKNSKGGLYGGFKSKEAAEACRRRWEREERNNPWNSGLIVFIEEK